MPLGRPVSGFYIPRGRPLHFAILGSVLSLGNLGRGLGVNVKLGQETMGVFDVFVLEAEPGATK